MQARLRGRELGLPFQGTTGPANAITDVPGVGVGFATIVRPEVHARTGVTAIVPCLGGSRAAPFFAGMTSFNGNGEMTGAHWVRDGGVIGGPICITNTHSVGIVHHATVRWMVGDLGRCGGPTWAMPVVAETYDGTINDIDALHVGEAHALEALDGAKAGPVAEGNVGGGTGMIAYGFKGGTGTASRAIVIDGRAGMVGALVQANFGRRAMLTVLGVPVGRHMPLADLPPTDQPRPEIGSLIVVLATDMPLLPHQLDRLARRATLGMARTGTTGGNGSGDLFLGFSTANREALAAAGPFRRYEALDDGSLDTVYQAAVEATEEAIINAMLQAESVPRFQPPEGEIEAIHHARLLELMRAHGRF